MQSEILKSIAGDIEIEKSDMKEEKIVFGKRGYNSFIIEKKNFSRIERKEEKKIAFIDGGNAEIIGSTNFSVQLIRVYCCVFKGNEKTDEIKNEFFVLADSRIEGEDVVYKAKSYPVKGCASDNFSINSMDAKITEGGRRAKISKVGEIIRRISEIRIAEEIIEKGKANIIVFDGTLECCVGEEGYLDNVYENALIKGVVVCSLAKTANLFTDKGRNALAVISRSGDKGVWMYDNLAEVNSEEHRADISIVKMNERSNHVFMFEIFKQQKEKKKAVLGSLAANCRDVSFPGYPYGLIIADRFARVSNKEKEYLKNLFLAKSGSKTREFLEETSNMDSHDILDSIN